MNGVRVAAMVPTGEAAHFHTDQVDSVKVVTNDAGAVVSRMEYLPYGETWFQEGDDRFAPKYNSQELDRESGYYFYNARYYDPQMCRFVTADTVIPDLYNTQSWNRLSYVQNNPIMYKDPTGHIEIEATESREGDVLLRTEGGKTEDIQKSGLDYGHAALVKNVKKDKKGNVTEMTVIDLGGSGVKERVITKKGSYVVNNQGKRVADDNEESISQYKSFRVGTKEEGKAAIKRAESQKGEIEYDTKALLGLTAPPKVGMKPRDYAKADDKKMVCSEFVNDAYGGKFNKDVRGTTPDDIYKAQKNLGTDKKGNTID